MMITLFLKLVLCHLLGDFVLQPKRWVVARKTNVWYLLIHVFVHALLLVMFFFTELHTYGQALLFIVSAHLAIDILKIWVEQLFPKQSLSLFVVDQLMHLSVLVLVVTHYFEMPENWWLYFYSDRALMYYIALLLTVFVSPIILRIVFARWDSSNVLQQKQSGSLAKAGLYIGIMERLLIVLFIQLSFFSGIGFLLAAKSIFRFGDLSNAKDTKFTEYVLVGTMASFVLAIAIGCGLRLCLQQLP